MLPMERNKTLHWNPNTFLSPNQNAPFAGLRGLGDYYGQGKLERALQLGNVSVFGYDSSSLHPGLGDYSVFGSNHPNTSLGRSIPKLQGMDCGCGCGGSGTCLGNSNGSGLGQYGAEDSDILHSLTSGYGGTGSGNSVADTMALVATADPEPILRIALTVGATAINFISSVESFFGIGAGRREADEIVPFQNQLYNQVIAPIYAQMAQGAALSCGTIATLYLASFKAWQQWMHFLRDTEWSDGRAAQQAEMGHAPYWNAILGSDSGAIGGTNQFGDTSNVQQGGLERIFNSKQCGSWIPQTQTLVGGVPLPATIVQGVTNPAIAYGISTVQNYLPWILGGIAVYALARRGRGKL